MPRSCSGSSRTRGHRSDRSTDDEASPILRVVSPATMRLLASVPGLSWWISTTKPTARLVSEPGGCRLLPHSCVFVSSCARLKRGCLPIRNAWGDSSQCLSHVSRYIQKHCQIRSVRWSSWLGTQSAEMSEKIWYRDRAAVGPSVPLTPRDSLSLFSIGTPGGGQRSPRSTQIA